MRLLIPSRLGRSMLACGAVSLVLAPAAPIAAAPVPVDATSVPIAAVPIPVASATLDTRGAVRDAVKATARETEVANPSTSQNVAERPPFVAAARPSRLATLVAVAARLGCGASSHCGERDMPAAACRAARGQALAVTPGSCPLMPVD